MKCSERGSQNEMQCRVLSAGEPMAANIDGIVQIGHAEVLYQPEVVSIAHGKQKNPMVWLDEACRTSKPCVVTPDLLAPSRLYFCPARCP